jgi:hypothetical protein
MMILSIDVTPWAIVAIALGALFGALVRPRLYGVFAVLASIFGMYASAPIFGMTFNIFVSVSWLLSVFFGVASITNLIATWVRHIELELRTMREQLEMLRLLVEEKT